MSPYIRESFQAEVGVSVRAFYSDDPSLNPADIYLGAWRERK